MVGRPGGEAAEEGGRVQVVRGGEQGEGLVPQWDPLDQGPLLRTRPRPVSLVVDGRRHRRRCRCRRCLDLLRLVD